MTDGADPKKKYYYYICDACALGKGWTWPKDHCATCHYDNCDFCDLPGTLIPTSDWLKPGEKELKSWD